MISSKLVLKFRFTNMKRHTLSKYTSSVEKLVPFFLNSIFPSKYKYTCSFIYKKVFYLRHKQQIYIKKNRKISWYVLNCFFFSKHSTIHYHARIFIHFKFVTLLLHNAAFLQLHGKAIKNCHFAIKSIVDLHLLCKNIDLKF